MQRFKLFLFLTFSGFILSFVLIDPVQALENSKFETIDDLSSSQKMQLVLLLDTSSSMNGLIKQAKSQLWSTLVALSQTQKNGKAPVLEMALYEYGNSRLASKDGFVRQVVPFTSDMDAVSAALFELSTSGGDEYCGEVISQSLDDLAWAKSAGAAKIIFIAGNEGFDQGNTPFTSSCSKATEKGVVVNTIFCGPCETGVQLRWKEGADLTGGYYSCIDHNQATVYVATPYDDQLEALGIRLNETYLAYGSSGVARQQVQREQDANASLYGRSNALNRAAFKVSSNYNNSEWDFVDAYAADSNVVKRSKDLPAVLVNKSTKEVKNYVEELTHKRNLLQKQIRDISTQRDLYIQRSKTGQGRDLKDLEGTMLDAIYKQAEKKSFVRPASGLQGTAGPAFGQINSKSYPSAKVSLTDFAELIELVASDRDDHLLSLNDFLIKAQEPHTVVLDARSRGMFKRRHLKGAINIPYTEFSEERLSRMIRDPDTNILIYCNNNFEGDQIAFTTKFIMPTIAQQRGVKSRLLALNIPTHLTLRGYGYPNIYELDELVHISDLRLSDMWEGIATNTYNMTEVESALGR